MRSRVSLLALFLAVSSFAVPHFAHAAIPFFGPIVPAGNNVCPAGWGMLMMVINNIIEFLITVGIVFWAPLMIAYAGFLYVFNPVSPEGRSKANKVLSGTIYGIVTMLAAWMIVDAIMAVLYNPGTVGGTWASLVGTGGDVCLPQAGALPGAGLNQAPVTGISANGGVVTLSGSTLAQCSSGNTACSPAALQAAGFTPSQANVMSCIAVTESSGNPSVPCNGNACGLFQIMLTVNQLVGPACAKYNNGNPTINCPALCRGNDGAAVTTATCQPCVQAASDAQCNAQSAQYLYSKSGGYTPWTTASDNTKSAACVQKYGP